MTFSRSSARLILGGLLLLNVGLWAQKGGYRPPPPPPPRPVYVPPRSNTGGSMGGGGGPRYGGGSSVGGRGGYGSGGSRGTGPAVRGSDRPAPRPSNRPQPAPTTGGASGTGRMGTQPRASVAGVGSVRIGTPVMRPAGPLAVPKVAPAQQLAAQNRLAALRKTLLAESSLNTPKQRVLVPANDNGGGKKPPIGNGGRNGGAGGGGSGGSGPIGGRRAANDNWPKEKGLHNNVAIPEDQSRRIALSLDKFGRNEKVFRKDGSFYINKNGHLPSKPLGYYRRYGVVPQTGKKGSSERLIIGKNDEVYYSVDHYGRFTRIR